MFTIHQIHQASSKVKSGDDLPQLVQDLKSMGVDYYTNYVVDGKTKWLCKLFSQTENRCFHN